MQILLNSSARYYKQNKRVTLLCLALTLYIPPICFFRGRLLFPMGKWGVFFKKAPPYKKSPEILSQYNADQSLAALVYYFRERFREFAARLIGQMLELCAQTVVYEIVQSAPEHV